MSKVKMRCIACGKWFQSANAKEVTCPDCTQKARKEKMAAKNAPPAANKPAGLAAGTGPTNPAPVRPAAPPPKPKQEQGGTNQWLDRLNDVKVAQPEQPSRPKVPSMPAAPRENRGGPGGRGPGGYHEGGYRGPGGYREYEQRGSAPYRVGGGAGLPGTAGPRPRQPMEGSAPPGRNFRPDRQPHQGGPRPGAQGVPKPKAKMPRVVTSPKPKKEKTPPPKPFEPTPEQVVQVEMSYLELAVPAEFDGIRTQISKELSIPKKAVKKIVGDLRVRQNIPSWWELQTYKGSDEEMEKIKAAYEPYLPVPPVGVHRQIAETLSFKPTVVYQAIKAIRQEMNLPQYNDPALHELELRLREQADGQQEQPAPEAAAVQNTSEEREGAPAEATATGTEAVADGEPTVETATAPASGSEAEQ